MVRIKESSSVSLCNSSEDKGEMSSVSLTTEMRTMEGFSYFRFAKMVRIKERSSFWLCNSGEDKSERSSFLLRYTNKDNKEGLLFLLC